LPNFRLVVAYDGTDYVGWQRQARGTSVQGLIEDALREIDGRDVTVHGAGRTDAGVHALGQVASCSLERSIDPATLVRALNAHLPADVRISSAAEVPATFHPRFDAHSKSYRYRIWNGDVLNPFERRYVWHVIGALDVAAMERAARMLEGVHDFAAFQGTGSDAKTTTRTIFTSVIVRSVIGDLPTGGELLTYEIVGDGFLRHMVRAIVGTLVEVGRGRRPAEWMAEVLASRNRALAGQTAPPHGLVLASVRYRGAACG
jgi:tRNA pseudouridine38-40 synthase